MSSDLNNIFFEQPFRVPDYFALVTRALIVLEGIMRYPRIVRSTSSKQPTRHGLRRARELFGVEGLAAIALLPRVVPAWRGARKRCEGDDGARCHRVPDMYVRVTSARAV